MARFAGTVGLDRSRCLYLNDSKVELGANRDRHENAGARGIGAFALGAFISHTALVGVPAILEVPGGGHGARAQDVAAGRAFLALGLDARHRS